MRSAGGGVNPDGTIRCEKARSLGALDRRRLARIFDASYLRSGAGVEGGTAYAIGYASGSSGQSTLSTSVAVSSCSAMRYRFRSGGAGERWFSPARTGG